MNRKQQDKIQSLQDFGFTGDNETEEPQTEIMVYGLSGDSTVQCYKVYAILRMQSDDINKIFCGQRI